MSGNDPNTPTTNTSPRRSSRRRWVRWIVAVVVLAGGCWLLKPVARDFALGRARVLLDEREHDAALTWAKRAEFLESDSAEAHFLLARAYRRLEDFDAARAHLKRAHDLGWDTEKLEREQWIALAQTGQFSRMRRHFPELFVNAGADGPEISNGFVLMELSQFRLHSALAVINAWKRDFPKDARPHFLRGRIGSVVRNWKEAEREFAKAVELDPEFLQARYELARTRMELHQFKPAEETLRDGLSRFPDDPTMIVLLATTLRKREDNAGARELLERHWDTIGDRHDALSERGHIELASERPKKAVTYFRKAVGTKSVDLATRYAYAQALRAAKQTEAAAEQLAIVNEATKPIARLGKIMPRLIDEPENVPLRFEIAELTWKHKSRKEGAKWFHSVLQFDAHHKPTHLALAKHYELLGNKKLAATYRSKAQASDGVP